MDVITIAIGGALLLFGRLLYWLFVGVVGFFLGSYIGTNMLDGEPALVTLIGVVAGLLGIAMAYVIQYMAVGLAGFILGGYLFTELAELLEFNVGEYSWIAFVVGGVVGVLLVGFIFDWSLILLSSFAGSALIVGELSLSDDRYLPVFLGLAVLGVIVQGVIRWSREAKPEEEPE